MAKKKPPNPAGRNGRPLSMAPLKPEEAIKAIFQISPEDVERITGKPSKARPKKAE